MVSFIEIIDEKNRSIFEKPYTDTSTGVTVRPFFVITGEI